MDDFGDFASSEEKPTQQGFNNIPGESHDIDPEADFLAREQAAFAAISLNEPLPTSQPATIITSPSGFQSDTLFGTLTPYAFIWDQSD